MISLLYMLEFISGAPAAVPTYFVQEQPFQMWTETEVVSYGQAPGQKESGISE